MKEKIKILKGDIKMNKALFVVGGFVVGYVTHREIMKLAFKEWLDKEHPKSEYSDYHMIFGTRDDAVDVLGQLHEFLDNYGRVTVADLLDLSGVLGPKLIDNKYGWKILLGAYVTKDKNGWALKLPTPRLLD